LGVLMGFQDFVTLFSNEALFQDMGYGWLLGHLFVRFTSQTHFHLSVVFLSWFDSTFDI
jgi:hypothetical protein